MNYVSFIEASRNLCPDSLANDRCPGWYISGHTYDETHAIQNKANLRQLLDSLIITPEDHEVACRTESLEIELLAYHYSFHNYQSSSDKGWGIYYHDYGIRLIACKLLNWANHQSHLDVTEAQAKLHAYNLLRSHENFHFLLSYNVALLEQLFGASIWFPYKKIYRDVFKSRTCYEESLANKKMVLGSSMQIKSFAETLANNGPWSYGLWANPAQDLWEGLGNQVLVGGRTAYPSILHHLTEQIYRDASCVDAFCGFFARLDQRLSALSTPLRWRFYKILLNRLPAPFTAPEYIVIANTQSAGQLRNRLLDGALERRYVRL